MRITERSILSGHVDMYNIATDLVIYRTQSGGGQAITIDDICNEYGIDRDELNVLITSEEFKSVFKQAQELVKEMGADGGLKLRMRGMAMSLSEHVYKLAMQSDDLSETAKAWAKMVQFAGMDPATNGTNKGSTDTGERTQVIINIPAGVPGLDHLKVIDHVSE